MNMKKRSFYTSILLIAISLISYTSDVIALNYEIGFNTNDELVWICNVCDSNKMNDVFGENWSSIGLFEKLSQGKRMKWKIITIEENLTSLISNINVWMWKTTDNWGSYNYSTEISYLKDPSQYPSNYNLSNFMPFIPLWFPVPIGQYIGSLKISNIYDIDNRVLPTLNVEITKDFLQLNSPSERIAIIAIYNTDGILNSLKLYTSGNVVVVDIEFESLPVYAIPATLGLIGAFFIAIILYMKKQRKN